VKGIHQNLVGQKIIILVCASLFVVPVLTPAISPPMFIFESTAEEVSRSSSQILSFQKQDQKQKDVTVEKEIHLNYYFPPPEITTKTKSPFGTHRLKIADLKNTNDLHLPRLPVKPLRILLPSQTRIKKIKVLSYEPEILGTGYNPERGRSLQELIHISRPLIKMKTVKLPSSSDIYSLMGVYQFRGYSICYVNLYPISYTEENGELVFHSNISVKIITEPYLATPVFRNLQKDKEIVTSFIENPSALSTYDEPSPFPLSRDLIDYVIVTNDEIAQAMKNREYEKRFDGFGLQDGVHCVATDSDDNVYVVGYGQNLNGSIDRDWWIKKFDRYGGEDTVFLE